MSAEEIEVIRRSVVAIIHGPFLDDCEFQTRVGAERTESRSVLDDWTAARVLSRDPLVQLVINNCCNEIVNGLEFSRTQKQEWGLEDAEALAMAYQAWKTSTGLI